MFPINIEMFFNSKMAILCNTYDQLQHLCDICKTAGIEFINNSHFHAKLPIAVYYDSIDDALDEPILNYVSGKNAMMDWGLPIVALDDIITEHSYAAECENFLELI